MNMTEKQRAIGQLAVGAFFFACRSCEYLKVPQAEKKRTDILRVRCIRFLKDGKILNHKDKDLERADSVCITFEKQKKDEKFDTVTQQSTNDLVLCPVRSWAAIIKRLWGYPGTNEDTPVSTVMINGRIDHITSKMMVNALENGVVSVGREKVNIFEGELGTHSIRSGAAMAMYLGNVPIYSIMLLGRWSSDAFLRYIRKQVEQFSNNISKKMLLYQFHRHVPEAKRIHHRLDNRL